MSRDIRQFTRGEVTVQVFAPATGPVTEEDSMTNPDHTNSSQEVGTVSHDGTEGGPATAALTTGLVSFRQPDGLVLSTGNLYFTSHDANFGTVRRMAPSAVPRQQSTGSTKPRFNWP
jgi:hypothetical protein